MVVETGAGKSILLDALGLATGARGDAGLVRQDCAQGSVTAIFQLSEMHPVQNLLNEINEFKNGPSLSLSIIQLDIIDIMHVIALPQKMLILLNP